MANTLAAGLSLTGSGTLLKTTEIDQVLASWSIGANNFDAIETGTITDGTSADQANEIFYDERSVLTTANDDLDLAGSLTNPHGETITFTKIKLMAIAIDTQDGSKKLRVGPQGVANAWQGPFGGVAAANYIECVHTLIWWDFDTGSTVTAGTGDILRINNPTAGTVVYRILLIGTK